MAVIARLSALLGALALVLATPETSGAFEAWPTRLVFDDQGAPVQSATLFVRNTNAAGIAIEIVGDGSGPDPSATSGVTVWPPQKLIAPGETATFLVEADVPALAAEQFFWVKQLPISVTRSDGAAIKVGVNMRITVETK